MSELEVTEVVTEEVPAELTPDPVELLQAEVDSLKDQYLRAKAETENVRRRGIEDTAKARKYAIESFADSLLAVADSLDAALQTEQSEGLKMTQQQLLKSFEKNNLKPISPLIKDSFDPREHQAISSIESDQESNTIVSVLQKGYKLADRVLRPAMVAVSKQREEIKDGQNNTRGSDEDKNRQDSSGTIESVAVE